MSDITPQLHRLTTVCERLSLSRSTVYRMVEDGTIRAIKIGKAIRVSEAEIQRLIASWEGQE